MPRELLVHYHSNRATQELDLGLAAQSSAAARAHLKLAALHLARLRDLGAAVPVAVPPIA
jgi:hypothetical protein